MKNHMKKQRNPELIQSAILLALLLSISLSGTAASAAVDENAAPPNHEAPTYSGVVADLVYNNCTPCHRPDGGAPFHFTSYEEVKKRARLIARVTADKLMPPWKAEKGDVAFMGERHLSEEQIATLAAWFEAGAPLGDEAAVPPAPQFSSGWKNGEPDIVLEMEQAFSIPAEGPDIYRGFVIRIPELPEGTYLKGLEYRPRAIETAHHTLFSLDASGEYRMRDEASERPGFGGMEGNLSLGRIGGWAVGSVPHPYPDGVAIPVKPGSDLVLNAHFHPSGKPEEELAQVGLYLTKEAPTRHMVAMDVPFGFGVLKALRIPAGEANHVVEESFTLTENVELQGISPHAHYIATSMRAIATLPDGREMTLISVPRWDFAWQEQYRLAEPLPLPKGTRIDMTFTYDNSADNPWNPNNPPKEITFGPQTTDEMACMTMLFVTDSAEDMQSFKEGYVAWVKEGIDKADLSILIGSAQQQRRDALDINSDGSITIGEILQRVKLIRRRMADSDTENLHMQILPAIGAHLFSSVVLPWLLPRAAVAVVVAAGGIFLLRRLIVTRRRKRTEQEHVAQGA